MDRETRLRQVMIPKAALKHGAYYEGVCRNATLARWDREHEWFTHWRTKFGRTFVEAIRHPEDETHWDVFWPLRLTDPPEKEIPFTDRIP